MLSWVDIYTRLVCPSVLVSLIRRRRRRRRRPLRVARLAHLRVSIKFSPRRIYERIASLPPSRHRALSPLSLYILYSHSFLSLTCAKGYSQVDFTLSFISLLLLRNAYIYWPSLSSRHNFFFIISRFWIVIPFYAFSARIWRSLV